MLLKSKINQFIRKLIKIIIINKINLNLKINKLFKIKYIHHQRFNKIKLNPKSIKKLKIKISHIQKHLKKLTYKKIIIT
jgi:hypothetical protein